MIGFVITEDETTVESTTVKKGTSIVGDIKDKENEVRPRKFERDSARNCEIDPQLKIPESGIERISTKSQDFLKNHNNSNHIACDLENLVKVEV